MGVTLFGKLLVCTGLLSVIEMLVKVESAGQRLILNKHEEKLSSYMKQLKYETLQDVDKKNFLRPNFYGCKIDIDASELFQIINKMPKAASLDGNLFGLFSHNYLYHLTFASGLYIRIIGDNVRFSYRRQTSKGWQNLSILRNQGNISEIYIKQLFSFEGENFRNYTAYNSKLTKIVNTVKTLLSNISVFQDALYQMLAEFYADNIMYVEFRYSLDFSDTRTSKKYEPMEVLKICEGIIKKFKWKNSRFFEAKIIYNPINQKQFNQNLGNLMQMVHYYPEMLVGYDVQVDEKNLAQAVTELEKIPAAIQIFLHFNKELSGTNVELLKSMVNRPSRYAQNNKLLKNKAFYDHIRGLGVGIGIYPLSALTSSVLKLSSHSSVKHIKNNYHVIIGTDNPGLFQVTGVSYDWYLLFVLMVDEKVDLAYLKLLALNSLIYSGLQEVDAIKAISIWTKLWYRFIEDMQTLDYHKIK